VCNAPLTDGQMGFIGSVYSGRIEPKWPLLIMPPLTSMTHEYTFVNDETKS